MRGMSDTAQTATVQEQLAQARAELELEQARTEIQRLRAEQKALEDYNRWLGPASQEAPASEPKKPAPKPRNLAEAIYFGTVRSVSEAYSDYASYTGTGWGALVDPLDAYTDVDGFLLPSAGIADRRANSTSLLTPLIRNELQLLMVRGAARLLLDMNPFAIGILENLVAFTVGDGMPCRSVWRKGHEQAGDDLPARIQDTIDTFYEAFAYDEFQQELVWRTSRDGEYFLRYEAEQLHNGFRTGVTNVSVVEPEFVTQQNAPSDVDPHTGFDAWSWGIHTPHLRPQVAIEYNLQPWSAAHSEQIAAQFLDHTKVNVDRNLKRGIPDFAPVADGLEGCRKLVRNTREGAAVMAAIAGIWEYDGTSASQVQGAITQNRDAYRAYTPHPVTGKAINYQKIEPGTFVHGPKSKQFKPLTGGQSNTPGYVSAVQMALRAVAVRWGMPEYIVSSDASNANFASILVAGSPFVRQIQRRQKFHKRRFLKTLWRVIRAAWEARHYGDVPWGYLVKTIELQMEPPTPQIADRVQEATASNIEHQAGVLSTQTWRARRGYDNDLEKRNLEEEPPAAAGGGGAGKPPAPGAAASGEEEDRGGLASFFPRPKRPDDSPGKPAREHITEAKEAKTALDDDPDAFAEMAADILYGLFGEKALALLLAPANVKESRLHEAWNPQQHPRGKNGRFIKKGSVEASAAAKEAINKALRGEHTPAGAAEIMGHLNLLTVKQLHEIHKEHGARPPSRLRDDLVENIKFAIEHKGKAHEPRPASGPSTSGPAGSEPPAAGAPVAGETKKPSTASGDQEREAQAQSAGAKTAARVPASREEVMRRIDRFEQHFRSRNQPQVADWMGMLREHVNAVGTDEALKALGAEVSGTGAPGVQYEGEKAGWEDMSDFGKAYLDRYGITSVHDTGGAATNKATISSLSKAFGGEGGRNHPGDFQPLDPTLKDKLAEAQKLPGLETSEDLGKIMGRPVTHLSQDVLDKMDERYGKGQWIIKTYGDYAFAGNGIFFPQRAEQIRRDARANLWTAGEHLSRYGFSHLRDGDGKVVGIKHQGGDEYHFGTEKYEHTIHGDVRHWGDVSATAADNEQGAQLPFGGQDFMAQPAFPVVGISNEERAQGITFKRGQEGRTHIVTRNGKAELIPHTTWLKMEPMPVVFEDDDTRAMAQAAVDAINALPESERQGQVYAPDIVRTANGYKVVEANPSNYSGPSGYLGDNPFIIDSYVSHLTGREPAHVRFIRKLLTSKKKGGEVE